MLKGDFYPFTSEIFKMLKGDFYPFTRKIYQMLKWGFLPFPTKDDPEVKEGISTIYEQNTLKARWELLLFPK